MSKERERERESKQVDVGGWVGVRERERRRRERESRMLSVSESILSLLTALVSSSVSHKDISVCRQARYFAHIPFDCPHS